MERSDKDRPNTAQCTIQSNMEVEYIADTLNQILNNQIQRDEGEEPDVCCGHEALYGGLAKPPGDEGEEDSTCAGANAGPLAQGALANCIDHS